MARKILSDAQFAGLEGGSRRLSDKSEGPGSGYYVSRDPDVPVRDGGSMERVVPDHSPADVAAHHDAIKEAGAGSHSFGQNKDDVYQGTWSSEGKRYLDVSDRYGATTSGLMHALQHGMANAQLAGWNAHAMEEMPITDSTPDGETKLGTNPRARYVANSLHAQEARRSRMR